MRITTLLGTGAVLVALAMSPATAFAQAGGGDFAGTVNDPATGFRCITAACDTVVTPDNKCICQKLTPNAMKASEVSLSCTTGNADGNQACTPPRFGK